MASAIRIGIVDDHPIFLAGLRQAIQSTRGFEVIAQGQSMDEALSIAGEHHPDVVLLDIDMPGNGIEAARRIAVLHPQIRIIMLSGMDDDVLVSQSIDAGAQGYVVKGVTRGELCDAIKAVQGGEGYISARLATRYALEYLRQRSPAAEEGEEMSERELEIFSFAREGLNNREIAQRLDLSLSTVKNTMSRVLRKLNSRNRIEALQKCEFDLPAGERLRDSAQQFDK